MAVEAAATSEAATSRVTLAATLSAMVLRRIACQSEISGHRVPRHLRPVPRQLGEDRPHPPSPDVPATRLLVGPRHRVKGETVGRAAWVAIASQRSCSASRAGPHTATARSHPHRLNVNPTKIGRPDTQQRDVSGRAGRAPHPRGRDRAVPHCCVSSTMPATCTSGFRDYSVPTTSTWTPRASDKRFE